MPPFTFFLIPITALFLLISLGLVAKGVADLSSAVHQLNKVNHFGNQNGNPFNFSSFSFDSASFTSRTRSSSTSTSTPAITGASLSRPSPLATSAAATLGAGGSSFSSILNNPYYSSILAGGSDDGFSDSGDGSYDQYLSSLLDGYSADLTFFTRRDALPTNLNDQILRRAAEIEPTPVPMRQTIEERQQELQPSVVRGFDSSKTKRKLSASLAFFVIQLACIVALLGLTVALLFKHRKFHTGGFEYEQLSFLSICFKAFLVVTIIYLISGIISFALLGSIYSPFIGGILSATIAFWCFGIISLIGLLVAFKFDAKRMKQGATSNGGPERSTSSHPQNDQQQYEQPQSQYQQQYEQPQSHHQSLPPTAPPVSMPQSHVPTDQQHSSEPPRSTAEDQQ